MKVRAIAELAAAQRPRHFERNRATPMHEHAGGQGALQQFVARAFHLRRIHAQDFRFPAQFRQMRKQRPNALMVGRVDRREVRADQQHAPR